MNESRWAIRRGLGACSRRFRSAAATLPRAGWVEWARTLALGALLTALAVAGTTQIARAFHERGMQAWDHAMLLRVEQLPLSFPAAVWWEAFGASSMLIPVTLMGIVVSLWFGRPILATQFLAAFLLAKPIFILGWRIWDRARPDLIGGGIAAPTSHSFPSGHAVQTVAIYGFLSYLWLRRSSSVGERIVGILACLALASMVALARVRMGAHWPSDVIGGSLLGGVWLTALIVALRRAEAAGGR